MCALHKLFLDVLFPVGCLNCGKEGDWLCEKCLSKIKTRGEQVCPICEKAITPDGKTCFNCRKRSSLDGLLVCSSYRDKTLSKMIHLFKYRFVPDLHMPLAEIMSGKITSSSLPLPDLIVPVPLHPKRLRWRGFNQSALLAEQLSKNIAPGIEIPVQEIVLARTRHTSAQMKIKNHQERKRNIQNAFSVIRPREIKGKDILLVDDVATTGATLFECAKILKGKGAREVLAVVVARQETDNRHKPSVNLKL